jgi:integrating conjugative element protein (TIGR03761 family)
MAAQKLPHTNKSVKTTSASLGESDLTHEISLVLHNPIAQSLINGSWGYRRMGLLQFAKMMQSLWQAAKDDDPYAEWYLMRTYELITSLKEEIKKTELICQQKFAQLRGLEVQVVGNVNPIKFPLKFSTPFAYMAAYLIADLDYIFRQTNILKRLSILLDEDQKPAHFVQKMHLLFSHARQWKYTGVTRKDIRENNQLAQKASGLMGKILTTILNSEFDFLFLPRPQKRVKRNSRRV